MTISTHHVRARNLRINDQIDILSLTHKIITIEPFPELGILKITTEYEDEIGSISAVSNYAYDEIVDVLIPTDY